MSFVVVAAGHSGTRLLSFQLGAAPGWVVEHEPDTSISARIVCRRFEGRDKYGEVNSFLLTSARHIPADRKAVLLRDPREILASVIRSRSYVKASSALSYVREAISILDGLARDGFMVFKFKNIIRSRKYVVRCARQLGIETLEPAMVRVKSRVNKHPAEPWRIDEPLLLDPTTRDEFDQFNYLYGLA